MKSIITLTTDFGLKDHYVGAMKGVILSINPEAVIVDITHEVPPQDVFCGAFTLRNAYGYFLRGAIHVVVVDPGVGSERKPIVVEADGNLFVGPDNGVFTFVYLESSHYRVFEITTPRFMLSKISSTFHGRDIFAPVASYLSLGVPITEMGKEVEDPVRLHIRKPEVKEKEKEVLGEVIYIDSFGNLITNISPDLLTPYSKVFIGKRAIDRIAKSYTEVEPGELLAIEGSSGFLEVSVNRGSAAKKLDVKVGEKVLLFKALKSKEREST